MQEPQPQLAELLRTGVHPPSLLLQIVHIEFLDVKDQRKSFGKPLDGDSPNLSDETHRYAVKYILSDGEIMVQALLHRKLTSLRDVADVVIGDLLDIRHFAVKKSPRLDGHGHVAYLAIEDCHFLHRIISPKRALNEEEEAVKADNGRKRKRTHSHSHTVIAEGGAGSHISTTEMADKTERPLAKRPSLHHAPGPSTTGVVSPVAELQSRPEKPQQPAHTDAPSTLRRSTFLPPASGQVQTKQKEEMNQDSITEDRPDEKDNRSVLKNIFGARQIIFDEEEDDFCEALPTDQTTVKRRRKVLQKLDGNTSFSSQVSSVQDDPHRYDDQITPSKPPKSEVMLPDKVSAAVNPAQEAPPQLPQKSVRDGTFALSQAPTFYKLQAPPLIASKPQPPPQKAQTQPIPPLPTQPALLPSPPFHTLSSLRNPSGSQNLPAKSYTLTTLAVISWTGTTTIHRPGSLFPPKRHLKIIDPSLATSRPPSRQVQARQPARDPNPSSFRAQNSFQDAVTVAVYIDAANFKPESGTLVLFRGLVMQRLVNGDIILNAYGRLKEQRFEETIDKTEEVKVEGIKEGNVSPDRDSERPKNDSHWFITDHTKIRNLGYGSRLDYYLDWWAEKQRVREQPAQT